MDRNIRLTINGIPVDAEPGDTILEAARRAGIAIPTLCHKDGLPPAGSCFICAVRIEGWPGLWPSCATPVQNGQTVTTDSEEIRACRKAAIELLLSDHIGDCVAPCVRACPARLDIPRMNRLIKEKKIPEALAVIRQALPLPRTLGRICGRYCERACRRTPSGGAVAICGLTRFAADIGGCRSHLPVRRSSSGRRVAIVGAGAAGLSAAWFLLLAGYDCAVFEAEDRAGGLLRLIPGFRLPENTLDADIADIVSLGADLRTGVRVGRDIDLNALRRTYDAVLFSDGGRREAPAAFLAEGAADGLCFLRDLSGAPTPLRGTVIVIGTGAAASDVSRSAVRLGARRVLLLAPDTPGLDSPEAEAVSAAAAEGVSATRVRHVEIARAGSRFSVRYRTKETTTVIECESVIAVPERLPSDSRAREEGVFTAGEAVFGRLSAVHAIADGKRAAEKIVRYLSASPAAEEKPQIFVSMGRLSDEEERRFRAGFSERERHSQPALPPEEAVRSFREVSDNFSPEDATGEADRCLQCSCLAETDCLLRHLATEYGAHTRTFRGERRKFERDTSHPQVVYEPGKCILCGRCVRMAELLGVRPGFGFSGRGFHTKVCAPFGSNVREGLGDAAAACADVCPTGALRRRREPPK